MNHSILKIPYKKHLKTTLIGSCLARPNPKEVNVKISKAKRVKAYVAFLQYKKRMMEKDQERMKKEVIRFVEEGD